MSMRITGPSQQDIMLSPSICVSDENGVKLTDFPDGSRTFVNKNMGRLHLSALTELRKDRKFCDVMLKVDGKEIIAHKAILAIHSPYFHGMFAEGFQESGNHEISLSSEVVNWLSAQSLVDFMYTGQFTVTPTTVQGLIVTADHWQMTAIRDLCVDYMEQRIDPVNCLDVLSFAELYSFEKLSSKSIQMIKQRFPVVHETSAFLEQPSTQIEKILSLSDLSLGPEGEDLVLKALFQWLEHDCSNRVKDLPVLLRKVRLSLTSKECREKLLDNNELVQESEEIQQVVAELLGAKNVVRKSHKEVYVIGGFKDHQTGPKSPRLRSVECLDLATMKWKSCADFPMLCCASAAFVVHGQLFCVACEPLEPVRRGGGGVLVLETRIYEHNSIHDQWMDARHQFPVEAMEYLDNCLQTEGAVAVCPNTNSIYIVSHSEVCKISTSFLGGELYCNSVQLLPRPPQDLFSSQHRLHSAVVVNERLYVLGGDMHNAGIETVPTANVIMFDPHTNAWVARASMKECRAKAAVLEFNGKIFVCGGFNTIRLASVERYNPEKDRWNRRKSMARYRSHHQLLALRTKIVAVGGKSQSENHGGSKKVVGACEMYNFNTREWEYGPPMKEARCGFAAATV